MYTQYYIIIIIITKLNSTYMYVMNMDVKEKHKIT